MATRRPSHAWAGSTRKTRLPDNWPHLRRETLARCGGQCEVVENGLRCTKRASDVDHIINNASGGTDELDNLQGLCPRHHLRKSSAEGHRTQASIRASKKRPAEENPPPPRPLTPPKHRGF